MMNEFGFYSDIFKSLCKKRNLYLFGAGNNCEIIISQLFKKGFSICGIFDNDIKKVGGKINNVYKLN
ncbi:hypothetical protein [Pectinatus frisingensis]|uniref:hypothetical protein n=1 Tax=Pectinatus frisingensis TaxID=865 RepID=UPI0018C6C7AA|nr:hypothetical protein [Pectinatus frisingensis]